MTPPDQDEQNHNGAVIVQVYKQKNALKEKLGVRLKTSEPGHIAPEQIEEADKLIEKICENCNQSIGGQLEILNALWTEMQENKDPASREENSRQIFTVAHEIKDIASLCGYNLIAHFAESLRDYIAETTLNLMNQRIIIQAHVDAITTVHKNDIKDDEGPVADELKKMVKIAIKKYR